MLGFFCIRKQALYIGAKDGFAIGRRFFWRMTANIVVVALAVFPIVGIGAVVAQPSTVETSFLPPGDIMPELSNCAFKCGEYLFEPSIYFGACCWEFGEHGAKLALNSCTESSASIGAASLVVVAPKEISSNSSREQNGSDAVEVVDGKIYQIAQGVLLAIFIAWPIMFLGDAGPYGGMKPNVK